MDVRRERVLSSGSILNPASWMRWVQEVRDVAAARMHTKGFVATSTTSGMVYTPLPEHLWATKSFEFWAFLVAMLQRLRPDSLLEIGSGRSTIYLGEYASKEDKELVSLEESPAWAVLGNSLARFGDIQQYYIRHIPLADDGFFSDPPLSEALPAAPDMVYLDGPVGPRNGQRQIGLYRRLAQFARIVVLDDIHFSTVYPQVELFQTGGRPRDVVYFRYRASPHFDNYLAVLFEPGLRSDIDEIVRVLGIEVLGSVSESICIDCRTSERSTPVPLPE